MKRITLENWLLLTTWSVAVYFAGLSLFDGRPWLAGYFGLVAFGVTAYLAVYPDRTSEREVTAGD